MTWETDLRSAAPDQQVASRVVAAIGRLLNADRHLLESNANERSISHRLGLYLTAEFADWDVDCEFNRKGHDPKRLDLTPEALMSDDDEGTTVYPDIIVHKRDEPLNHLVVEIKKDTGGSRAKDLHKLRAFRTQLKYAHALFLSFGTGEQAGRVESEWA
jgi:hypothetical protein